MTEVCRQLGVSEASFYLWKRKYGKLGLTEIREFGATSVQIMRRLRALLEELLETVRPEHRAALEEELRRLDATVAAAWRDSVDLDRATGADSQGIGGPAHRLKSP